MKAWQRVVLFLVVDQVTSRPPSLEPAESPRLVSPFGAFSTARLLNPFSDHAPLPPPPSLRLIILRCSLTPRLRLIKRLTRLRGALTCTCAADGKAHLSVIVQDPLLGGRVELEGTGQASWRKLWLFPGLSDAATRVEVRSSVDLRTGRAHGEVKLGLRGLRHETKNRLRLVHRERLRHNLDLDAGATLTLPDELRLATSSSDMRQLFDDASVELDLDQLDLCVNL